MKNCLSESQLVIGRHYFEGSLAGHQRAAVWRDNPKLGDPRYGGTLQNIVLELAQKFAAAGNENERARARGEIVGFCYAVECPASAEACLVAARRRDKRA